LFGLNSKHIANLRCRECHAGFDLREIMKEHDLLTSRCVCAPGLGAGRCSGILRRDASLVEKRLDSASWEGGNCEGHMESEEQPRKRLKRILTSDLSVPTGMKVATFHQLPKVNADSFLQCERIRLNELVATDS
jgi:hypothetical protein